jgi:hypothetical protein
LSTFRELVHVAVPAGTVTVSPSLAEAMADLTSASETLFAAIVLASTWQHVMNTMLVVTPIER